MALLCRMALAFAKPIIRFPDGSGVAPRSAEPPRHDLLERAAAHGPFDMRCRRDAARTAGDHLLLRRGPPPCRHTGQAAHETARRLAETAAVPPAQRSRAAAPQIERVAIQPAGRDMRGIDLRAPLLVRAPLEVGRLVGKLFARWHDQSPFCSNVNGALPSATAT